MRLAVFMALLPALGGTAWIAVRRRFPDRPTAAAAAVAGAGTLALNIALPLALHHGGIPITGPHLALAHWIACLGAFSLPQRSRRPAAPAPNGTGPTPQNTGPPIPCPPPTEPPRRPFPLRRFHAALMVLWAVAVFPFTHLAGIDTYKWQDLATAVVVEGRIPWLIHPLSLLGFTPRAYPPAQPLLLATVRMLGGLGLEGSWFLISLFTGGLGLAAATVLGQRVFRDDRRAAVFALFYVFSPVFMRYGHWATGRGLFLALFPLALSGLAICPARAGWLAWAAAGAMLPLCHKTGLVALPLMTVAQLASAALPRKRMPTPAAVLAAGAAAVATLAAAGRTPAAIAAGIVTAATRFGWMAPAAPVALGTLARRLDRTPHRRLLTWLLCCLPLALTRDMYGAMIALAPLTLAAATLPDTARKRFPRRPAAATVLAAALSLSAAAVIVVHRNRTATPPAVRQAAAFLDAYDPHGPFVIHAPEPVRSQIQAYVGGSPRFAIEVRERPQLRLRSPPRRKTPAALLAREWTAYLRHPLTLGPIDIAWYGKHPRTYYVSFKGMGHVPAAVRRLYEQDGVAVFAPAAQSPPVP